MTFYPCEIAIRVVRNLLSEEVVAQAYLQKAHPLRGFPLKVGKNALQFDAL